MLSYDDTLNYKLEVRRRADEMTRWTAGLALAFLSFAVLLRKYFGAWSEKGFVAIKVTLLLKP